VPTAVLVRGAGADLADQMQVRAINRSAVNAACEWQRGDSQFTSIEHEETLTCAS
jgi:hypothetical protein